MSGYYDPNKDYSKELQRTDLTSAQRSQLQQERQNKIDDKYGGVEPVMTGSNKTYTQTYGGGGRDVEDAVKSTWDSVYSGSSKEPVKGPGYVTGGYTPGSVYGTAMLEKNPYFKDTVSGSGADLSRRPDLAGSYAVSNGYTVFYDEDGYATHAKKGVVDYTPHKDLGVGASGSYGASGAWTDNEILMPADRQRIQDIRARMQAGQLTGDQANQLANQIRSGYGYTIDKAGNVTDLGALSGVDARRRAWGLPTNPVSAEQQNFLQLMFPEQGTNNGGDLLGSLYALHQGTYNPQTAGGGFGGIYGPGGISDPDVGIMSFEEFLNSSGYSQYSDATQAAIRAAVQNAVRGYRDQIDTANDDTEELARQAYIAKMLGQKNLDQQLSASGYAGGMADSQRIAAETSYENQLNEIEKQRLSTVKELESAIVNAQLTGDMQTAQELASYLQNIQGQWMNYVQNQQQMANQNYWNRVELENQNYWNQQNLNSQNAEGAYTKALTLLGAGFLPDDETLAAAGIGRSDAQSYLNQMRMQAQAGTKSGSGSNKRASSGGGYNNGGLTSSQVQELQRYIGVTPDGRWGSDSTKASGGLTADAAWGEYQKLIGGSAPAAAAGGTGITPIDYGTVKANSASGVYGPAYNLVLNNIQAKWGRGADVDTLAGILEEALESNKITRAGADSIMRALGIAS